MIKLKVLSFLFFIVNIGNSQVDFKRIDSIKLAKIDSSFNSVFSKFIEASSGNNDLLKADVLADNFDNTFNKNLICHNEIRKDKSHSNKEYKDSLQRIFIVSDTVIHKDFMYLLVNLSVLSTLKIKNINNSITKPQTDIVIDRIFNDPIDLIEYCISGKFYKKNDSIYTSVNNRKFLLKKKLNSPDWKLIYLDKKTYWKNMSPELWDIFFELEKVSGNNCENLKMSPKEIGEYVFKSYKKKENPFTLYCELGLTKNRMEELEMIQTSSYSNKEMNGLLQNLKQRKGTIEEDSYNVMGGGRVGGISSAKLNKVYAEPFKKFSKNSYCNILVEYTIGDELKFFEIETGNYNGTWVIIDDINLGASDKKNKEIIKRRELEFNK